MSAPTRRGLMAGTLGLGLGLGLACAGVPASELPPSEPTPDPSPPKVRGSAPTSGRLYLPGREPEGRAPKLFPARPTWLRRTPAIYLPAVVTSGSGTLCFAEQERYALPSRIQHFDELPRLLEEARALGTSTVFLIDHWQAPPPFQPANYWQYKEFYLPREAMGGAAALAAGIKAIQQAGGRVILYFSAFALYLDSPTGQANGRKWSILQEDGPITEPYEGYAMPCPQVKGWQEHLAQIARRYAAEYGADGAFLDSYGNQRGWRCQGTDHGHAPGDSEAFNEGCLQVSRLIKGAMRESRPEAITLVEAPKLSRLFETVDGSQAWGIHELTERWCWNQAGNTSIFTTGWSRDDLNQILALGHKWALTPQWLEAPDLPSAAAWIDRHYPRAGGKSPLNSEKMRRYWAERLYRGLHAFRNAGQRLGRAMPSLEDVTFRRWDGEPHFQTAEAFAAHWEALRKRAVVLDQALVGAGPFPRPADELRPLMAAREALSPHLDDGGEVRQLDLRPEQGVAWQLGAGASVVNVSAEEIRLDLGALGRAPLRDLVSGETLKAGSGVPCPPHTVRLFGPA